jgi:fatty acid-binding protein DegV
VLVIDEGIIDVYKKVRGLPQALETMRDGILEKTTPGSPVYVSLSHALNLPVLEQFRALVDGIEDRDIRVQPYSIVGPVIGTYVGPGALALGFIQE